MSLILNNFSINVEGHTYWVGPSIAVIGFIFYTDENGKTFILANKRGRGLPNEVGKWNAPCGYLDRMDKSLENGLVREIMEETGIVINPKNLIYLNHGYDNKKANLNMRFYHFVSKDVFYQKFTTIFSEKNEVEEVKWICIDELSNYEWAFNHDKMILNAFDNVSKPF